MLLLYSSKGNFFTKGIIGLTENIQSGMISPIGYFKSKCILTDILSLAKNDIDRDISLGENDNDRDISLGENDIERDISLAKNYIDREGQQQDKSNFIFFIHKISLCFCRDTLSLAENVNNRDPLFS